jgi:arginine transport system substrate-binding protein
MADFDHIILLSHLNNKHLEFFFSYPILKEKQRICMLRLAIFFIFSLQVMSANAQSIRIGMSPFSPPFLIASDGHNHYSGFDADLMSEICKRIDADCIYKPMPSYKALLESANKHNIDLAIGGVIITPEREGMFFFSLPYLKSTAQYVTRFGEPIKQIKDIPGKIIGVAQSTVFQNLATSEYGKVSTIKTYDTLSQLLLALSNGDVDVVLLNGLNAEYWIANSNNIYQVVGNPIPVGLGYAIVGQKDDQQLILQINQALLSMEKDGTYLKLYNTYF